jgi:hypothetical protein
LRISKFVRFIFQYFFSQVYILLKCKNLNDESISGFENKNIYFFRNYFRIRRTVLFSLQRGSKSRGKVFNVADPM